MAAAASRQRRECETEDHKARPFPRTPSPRMCPTVSRVPDRRHCHWGTGTSGRARAQEPSARRIGNSGHAPAAIIGPIATTLKGSAWLTEGQTRRATTRDHGLARLIAHEPGALPARQAGAGWRWARGAEAFVADTRPKVLRPCDLCGTRSTHEGAHLTPVRACVLRPPFCAKVPRPPRRGPDASRFLRPPERGQGRADRSNRTFPDAHLPACALAGH